MTADLSALLSYKNDEIIRYFCHYHSEYTEQEVWLLFEDLLAWLWLNQQRGQQGKETYLFGPLLVLDELWHVFILHTRIYFSFCTQYFGSYVHHDVEPPGLEHQLDEQELDDFLHDCFRYLGREWVARRFAVAFS